MTNTVSAASRAQACAPARVPDIDLACIPPPPEHNCRPASPATPGVDDFQSVLNEFGRMISEAHKGKQFGSQDKARLDKLLSDFDQRTDVSPERKAAMKKVADEFKASSGERNERVDSNDWADFMGRVGGLLKSIPGAERFGRALQDFATKFRTAYDDSDGKFGKDDMRALDRPRARPEADRLVDLAKSSLRGEQFNAADFGRFFADMRISPEQNATHHQQLVRASATPRPTAPSASPHHHVAPAAPVSAAISPVSATASGEGALAMNFVNNGTVNIGLPHPFSADVHTLSA